MPDELNPNHETLQALNNHWQKIAALAVARAGGDVSISNEFLDQIADKGLFLVVNAKPEGLHLKMVTSQEAQKLAKKAGGLPN